MENKSRKHLLGQDMGFNQMRNSIYWLQRFLQDNDISDKEISARLKDMGSNIGSSFSKANPPRGKNLLELMKNAYKITLNSSVEVKANREGTKVLVTDPKCALCKYQYPDITIPGCNIEVGLVKKLMEETGQTIENGEVVKSKVMGDEVCQHLYSLVPINEEVKK